MPGRVQQYHAWEGSTILCLRPYLYLPLSLLTRGGGGLEKASNNVVYGGLVEDDRGALKRERRGREAWDSFTKGHASLCPPYYIAAGRHCARGGVESTASTQQRILSLSCCTVLANSGSSAPPSALTFASTRTTSPPSLASPSPLAPQGRRRQQGRQHHWVQGRSSKGRRQQRDAVDGYTLPTLEKTTSVNEVSASISSS